jgi:hypothetical protein
MADLDRLLGFVSAHRNGMKVFRPSTMTLDVLTDASVLSRPNAGSVTGSYHHLARSNDPTFFNALISVHSTRIPVVGSSVQEAEYGDTFAAAKIADQERQVLSDFIATMKSLWAWPIEPSSPKCRSPATCVSIGSSIGFAAFSSECITFAAFGTWLISSRSLCP